MQSYPPPSPVIVDNGAGPFYSNNAQNQQQSSLRNPDDLQLTAQLTTGLAPMMGVASSEVIDGQVSRGHSQTNFNQDFEHDQDQHAHLQPSPSPLDQMSRHYSTQDGSSIPRKRSKVSRACDQCRRKKIRCDATNDQHEEHCSNCKRVGTRCQFSRVPMKRGPSKGYIKELADRLHTLEGAMHSGEMVPQFLPQNESSMNRRCSDEFSSSPTTETFSRKRKFSTATELGAYLTQRPSGFWNSTPQDDSHHLPHSSSALESPSTVPAVAQVSRDTNYSPTKMQNSKWRNELEQLNCPAESMEDLGHIKINSDRNVNFDDAVLEDYFKLIQPTFYLLPASKSKIIAQISSCPSPLREALYTAIFGAVKSFSINSQAPLDNVNIRRTAQYIVTSALENPSSRPLRLNILYLQTMLLLAVEVENSAFSHPRTLGKYSRSVWISNAVGLAYSIKLYLYKSDRLQDYEPDTDEKVSRRIWWSLFVMDRWNAASTSSPVLVPDSASVLYPEDLALLGDGLWNLARLSIILGHISTVNTVSSTLPPLSVPMASAYGTVVRGELERFRESFTNCQPLILMAYWHLRILVELQLVDSEPNDLLEIATNATDLIIQNPDFNSPLQNHFVFLIILTLVDLLAYDTTKHQSEDLLNVIFEKKIISAEWETVVRMMINRRKIQAGDTSTNLLSIENDHNVDIENLVRLADLATAAGANREAVNCPENMKTKPLSSPFKYYSQLRDQVRNGFFYAFTGISAQA
ncbi:hypothetical protein K3495_g3451 [Podosphaera aphanis]|nr:hypothetical protein K3495_g3451 [Podosphaera aphanis]